MNKIKQDTCHDNIIWILTVEMFLLVRQSDKSYDECTQFFSSPAVKGSEAPKGRAILGTGHRYTVYTNRASKFYSNLD